MRTIAKTFRTMVDTQATFQSQNPFGHSSDMKAEGTLPDLHAKLGWSMPRRASERLTDKLVRALPTPDKGADDHL